MGWHFLCGPFQGYIRSEILHLWRVKLLNNPKLAHNVRKRLNKENETEPEPLNTGQPSGTHPAFYPMSTGGSFSPGWNGWGVKLRYNRYSYHSYVRGVSAGYRLDSRGWIPRRGKMFLFSTKSRPVLGPTPPPIQWVPGALSPGVKTFANYNYFYIMP
jgi:hypothetical protein